MDRRPPDVVGLGSIVHPGLGDRKVKSEGLFFEEVVFCLQLLDEDLQVQVLLRQL